MKFRLNTGEARWAPFDAKSVPEALAYATAKQWEGAQLQWLEREIPGLLGTRWESVEVLETERRARKAADRRHARLSSVEG